MGTIYDRTIQNPTEGPGRLEKGGQTGQCKARWHRPEQHKEGRQRTQGSGNSLMGEGKHLITQRESKSEGNTKTSWRSGCKLPVIYFHVSALLLILLNLLYGLLTHLQSSMTYGLQYTNALIPWEHSNGQKIP